jgi:deoxyribose-phosphate aldolase
MEVREILARCDHTFLKPDATWADIKAVCDDGIKYGTATVCIPPSFVRKAKNYVGDEIPVCTVVGFPNGYVTTDVKVFEASNAVYNGADEIDMVVNIGMVKELNFEAVTNDIRQVKRVCGRKVLKVIIETCLLTDDEKIRMCGAVSDGGAEYIKTSTGFSTGGATRHDVELLRRFSPKDLKVKAAGGISSLQDAEDFIALGADRLGTSRIVKAVKELEQKELRDRV